MKLLQRLAFATLIGAIATGCVSERPVTDYTLAVIAMKAARRAEGARYAPGHWHNAEQNFRKARKHYVDREYDVAKEHFNKARGFAEKAENVARVRKFREGENF